MKTKAFSVYDNKAMVWTNPFYAINIQVAQRIIFNAVNDEGHNFNLNPEDYSLHLVGEFNDEDGVFTSHKKKILDLITLVPKSGTADYRELEKEAMEKKLKEVNS